MKIGFVSASYHRSSAYLLCPPPQSPHSSQRTLLTRFAFDWNCFPIHPHCHLSYRKDSIVSRFNPHLPPIGLHPLSRPRHLWHPRHHRLNPRQFQHSFHYHSIIALPAPSSLQYCLSHRILTNSSNTLESSLHHLSASHQSLRRRGETQRF